MRTKAAEPISTGAFMRRDGVEAWVEVFTGFPLRGWSRVSASGISFNADSGIRVRVRERGRGSF